MVTLDRSNFLRQVVSPFSGQEYEIRKLKIREYLTDMGAIPLGVPDSLAGDLSSVLERARDRLAERITEPDFEAKMRRYCVEKGVVAPMIWFGLQEDCPQDALAADNAADDLGWLATQVLEFTFDLAFTRGLNKFFRDGDSRAVGHDGEEVRGEAVKSDA